MNREEYLEFAKKAADIAWERYRENKSTRLVKGLAYIAQIDAAIFLQTGSLEYANRAKEMLYAIEENKATYKDENVFDFLFESYPYLKTYDILNRAGLITPIEKDMVEKHTLIAINWIFEYPEWGAHNRAMLRAVTLLAASKLFCDNSESKKWRKTAEIMAEDSLCDWTVEDASTYNPLWLNLVFIYAEISQNDRIAKSFAAKYYCEYFFKLTNPTYMPIEYGDGRLGSNWGMYISCLEKGASLFNDGEMKFAAHSIFNAMTKYDDATSDLTLKMATGLIDSFDWADDSIVPIKPSSKSGELLEDAVGKKIVFRDGWEDDSTYLLLNYKDEGSSGYLGKKHLKDTLTVTKEKPHHGHSDENSIVALVKDGSVLLHDGGYRTSGIPTGTPQGAYRADFYHNRLVARKGCYENCPNTEIVDFCRNFTDHNPVETQKIFFFSFEDIDVSRTRLVDKLHGVEADRVIYFVKSLGCFIVVDLVKAMESGQYTYGPLYFSQNVEKIFDKAFLTSYDFIGADEFISQIPNDSSKKLLIYYPLDYKIKTQEIERSYTRETAIMQYFCGLQKKDQIIPMVSILYPTTATASDGKNSDIEKFIESIKVSTSKNGEGITVSIKNSEFDYILGIKADMNYGLNDLNKRPTYSYENCALNYGNIQTDADFAFAKISGRNVHYGFVNATRLCYNDEVMFKALIFGHDQLDGSFVDRSSRWKRFEDTYKLKK